MNYSFTTTWHIEKGKKAVWNVLYDFKKWPTWWKGVTLAKPLRYEHEGRGSIIHLAWSTGWYSLSFNLEVTQIIPFEYIEAQATGDLVGTGRISLTDDNKNSTVQFRWDVQTQKIWMKLLGPIASSIFSYEHHKIMRQGEQGIKKLLDISLT